MKNLFGIKKLETSENTIDRNRVKNVFVYGKPNWDINFVSPIFELSTTEPLSLCDYAASAYKSVLDYKYTKSKIDLIDQQISSLWEGFYGTIDKLIVKLNNSGKLTTNYITLVHIGDPAVLTSDSNSYGEVPGIIWTAIFRFNIVLSEVPLYTDISYSKFLEFNRNCAKILDIGNPESIEIDSGSLDQLREIAATELLKTSEGRCKIAKSVTTYFRLENNITGLNFIEKAPEIKKEKIDTLEFSENKINFTDFLMGSLGLIGASVLTETLIKSAKEIYNAKQIL